MQAAATLQSPACSLASGPRPCLPVRRRAPRRIMHLHVTAAPCCLLVLWQCLPCWCGIAMVMRICCLAPTCVWQVLQCVRCTQPPARALGTANAITLTPAATHFRPVSTHRSTAQHVSLSTSCVPCMPAGCVPATFGIHKAAQQLQPRKPINITSAGRLQHQ